MRVRAKVPFDFVTVNIHDPANAEFFELYQNDIPVVAVNGQEIARHKLEEQVLLDALSKL